METLHALGFLRFSVVLAVIAGFVVLRLLRASTLAWAIGCWVGIYVLLGFGFATPIPSSVVKLYMGIVTLSLAAYVTSSDGRRAEFARPIVALVVEPRYRLLLAAVLVLLAGPRRGQRAGSGRVRRSRPRPSGARSTRPHPTRSPSATRRSTSPTAATPCASSRRSDPAGFRTHVENGRRTYYRNCLFCHGDALAGDGMFVHGSTRSPRTSPTRERSGSSRSRTSSGASRRAAPASPRRAGRGTRPCPPGRSS